jgi:acetyl esterase/lipase
MSFIRKYLKTFLTLTAAAVFLAMTYSWTFTPHGRLDYRAAFSLHLLSFEKVIRPDPEVDFEVNMPVNLIYAVSFALPKEQVHKVEDIVIPGPDADLPARIYWPATTDTPASPLPVIVFYHGGGFVVGSVDIFDSLTRALSNATSAVVVSVNYRLAPAHPYPAATIDAYAALEWAAENIDALGGDPAKLIVAGESAGGNLATVVALRANNEGGPSIAAQLLYYPGTDFTDSNYPSREKFADGYGLSRESVLTFFDAYTGHIADKSDPYLSPIRAPSLAGMPPTLMVTAGFDPLVDSCTAYTRRLQDDGVKVTHRHYPTMIHGFMNIGLFPQRREALTSSAAFLTELFSTATG